MEINYKQELTLSLRSLFTDPWVFDVDTVHRCERMDKGQPSLLFSGMGWSHNPATLVHLDRDRSSWMQKTFTGSLVPMPLEKRYNDTYWTVVFKANGDMSFLVDSPISKGLGLPHSDPRSQDLRRILELACPIPPPPVPKHRRRRLLY